MNLPRSESGRQNLILSVSGQRSRRKSAAKKINSVVKKLLVNERSNENGSKLRP
jgi:hypothetical protein